MEMSEMTIQIPKETLSAMEDLADITGVPGDISALIRNALQEYERLIYHESEGHKTLVETDNGSIEFEHLIKPSAMKKAKRYFVLTKRSSSP